jgi:CBS domain-containing protein
MPIELSRFLDTSQSVSAIAHQDARTCLHKAPASDVIQAVAEGHSRIPVVDEKGNFRGMIRALDVVNFLGGGEKYSKFLSGRFSTKAEMIMEPHADAVTPKHTIGQTLSGMLKMNLDSCPMLIGKKFSGMVTEASFIHRVRGSTGVKVRDAMVRKPMVVKDHMSVADAASIMARTGYRRLPVTSKGVLLGIITPHDIISHLKLRNIMHGLKEHGLPVTEAMNRNVVTVSPSDDLAVAIDKMKAGYGCLPVVEENELMGILAERDVLEQMKA